MQKNNYLGVNMGEENEKGENENQKQVEKIPFDELEEIENDFEDVDPEIFSGISEEKKTLILRAVSILQSSSHSGPLPRPEDLAKYDNIIPNGADRIMKMAEKQNDHRIEIEKSVVKSNNIQSSRGQIFGLVIAIVFLAASVYLGINGHDWLAGGIATTTIIGLVTVFVLGKKTQHNETDSD